MVLEGPPRWPFALGENLKVAIEIPTQEAAASRAFSIVYNAKTQKEFS